MILILTLSCIPSYFKTVRDENHIKKVMDTTLEITAEIGQEDYIMTNINALNWPTLLYYYPDTMHVFFSDPGALQFKADVTNWLFLGEPVSENIIKTLQEKGYSVDEVVSNGYVGTYKVWIYKVVRD